jgi:hypothetical protein
MPEQALLRPTHGILVFSDAIQIAHSSFPNSDAKSRTELTRTLVSYRSYTQPSLVTTEGSIFSRGYHILHAALPTDSVTSWGTG